MKLLLGIFTVLALVNAGYSQCESFPILDLGNDTLLCQGSTITYQLPAGYDFHSWQNGSNSSTFTVTGPDTVILSVSNSTPNLVINGDFENGNTGFTSAYIYGTGGTWGLLSNPGQYAIATSPNLTHTNFSNCPDHTPTGVGNMLVANGSSTPNTAVWCQTVSVSPNTDFIFSAWIGNALNDANVSNLQFTINSVQLGNIFSTTPIACTWSQYYETWNSGMNTSAQLCIVNQNTLGGGNDFILDDIYFSAACNQVDTVIVSYDTSTVEAGANLAFCENETESFTATANFSPVNFTWESTTNGSVYTPTSNGYYSVEAVSPFGCQLIDSALATITPMPWNIDLVDSQPTSCGSNDGVVYVTTTGSFNDPAYYTWNGPGATNPTQINASVWQNLAPGWYYLSIESDGCFRYDSVEVIVSNPPDAQVGATPTTGYAPLTVNMTNTSTNATSYSWDFGNGNTTTAIDLSGQTQVYNTPGTYTVELVAINGLCSDTTAITIVVLDPPIPPIPPVIVPVNISFPNIITANGDLVNDLFEPTLLNIVSLEISIVNRWGTTVYKSNSLTNFWDGKSGGLLLNEGVYFYEYKAIGAQGEELKGQGQISLITK